MELFKITADHQSLREAGALDHALGYVRERWQFSSRPEDGGWTRAAYDALISADSSSILAMAAGPALRSQ